MNGLRSPSRCARLAILLLIVAGSSLAAWAAVVPERDERFRDLILHDPISRMGQLGEDPETTPGLAAERELWRAFRSTTGGSWDVRLDRRSGTPLIVRGAGIPWFGPAAGEDEDGDAPITVEALEARAREFVRAHGLALKVRESELVLRAEGTGAWDRDHHVVLFGREIDGIPVENQRLRLLVSHGNLVAFGASLWGPTPRVPAMVHDQAAARRFLYEYMGLADVDLVNDVAGAELQLIPTPVAGETDRRFTGAVGKGVQFRLAWRFTVNVNDAVETWVGKVDAVSGEVLAFYDDTRYAQVKGGVYPVSNDGTCEDGCEQPGYPMPYADMDIDGLASTVNDAGMFECTPSGGVATTNLSGPFVMINDVCGVTAEVVSCDDDLDLSVSGGDDCATPAGSSSPGNTHSARSCFYHVNRAKEKARTWLPTVGWLDQQLECRVNVTSQCNATYGGRLNMYRSGGGCGNTGEIAGVVHHEYGHGLDQNDGGGSDNSSEAYADVVAMIQERRSCVGRGFRPGVNCGGYGDTCLSCTGIRDHDWDARAAHTPATPANFTQPRCGNGGGPCGRQVHCEAYVPSEAIFDLATRDLPAMGLDADSAWQLTERLWYASRLGSGGAIFNCSLPNSDGCGAGNWFMEMMTLDDDDGDLSNGTPHAAAIFAAFDRHAIACGTASDPENQNSGSCPTIDAPLLTGTPNSGTADLSWNSVANATEYRVLRTEVACTGYSMNVIDTVAAPGTTYSDVEIADDFEYFYRVQAVGSNSACESAVSNCVAVTPQPFSGTIKFGQGAYLCNATLELTVRDANVGASTVDVTVFSDSEPVPETVTLTETEPGSSKFVGTIQATTAPTASGDGLIQLTQADSITAEYIDDDDGLGGSGISKIANALADCVTLVRTSLTLDDSVGGNGDGILDPGEWVEFPIDLQNTGDDIARNVRVQVESLSPFVEVRRLESGMPDLPGGASGSTTGDQVQVRLTAGLPCTDDIQLRFHYLADGVNQTQDDTFSTGTKVTFDLDDFESGTFWQHIPAESTASTGDWLVGDPDGTTYQPEDDTTADPGVLCLFTQPNSGGLGTDDVDDGVVVARSGSIDLSTHPEARVTLMRWFANRDVGEDTGDFFRLHVREGSGSPDVLMEELDTNISQPVWTEVTFRIADYINVTNDVSLRVAAADGPATGNLVESAIDDVRFWDPECTTHDPAPNSVETLTIDLNLGDLDLSWQRPPLDPAHGEPVRYRVYRSVAVDGGFSEQQLVVDSGPNPGWTDVGAGGGTPSFYAYLVVSENDTGAAEPPPAP